MIKVESLLLEKHWRRELQNYISEMGVLPKKLFDVELLATGNSDTGEKFTYNI